jgi:hypothetical protein
VTSKRFHTPAEEQPFVAMASTIIRVPAARKKGSEGVECAIMPTVASVLGAVLLGLLALLALGDGVIRFGFRLWIAPPEQEREARIRGDREQRASFWAVILLPLGILIAVTIIRMVVSCLQQ